MKIKNGNGNGNDNGNGNGLIPTWLIKTIIAFISTLLVVAVTVVITVLQALDKKITIIDEQQDSISVQIRELSSNHHEMQARLNRVSIRQLEVFKQLVSIYRDTGFIDRQRLNKKIIEGLEAKDIDEGYKKFFERRKKEMEGEGD